MDEVRVGPQPITPGDKIRVNYDGLLAKSGANQVYLHAGMVNGDKWQNVTNVKMKNENGSWTADVKVKNAERFSFCFKDCANNWDNNNGHNWSYDIYR